METSVGKCPHENQLQGSLEGIFLISGWYGRTSSLWMGHCWVVVLDSERKNLAEHHGEQGIIFHGFCTSLCLDFFRYENVSQINPFLPNFILVIVIYHIGQIYFCS